MLGLHFHHKFRTETDLGKDGKLFLHQNGKFIIHTRLSRSISNILSTKYQEIPPFPTTIIQAKFENWPQLDVDTNYIIKDQSELKDNDPNLKGFPGLIKNDTLQNNVVPLLISNNMNNKICIPKDIIVGCQEFDNDKHIINEITETTCQLMP